MKRAHVNLDTLEGGSPIEVLVESAMSSRQWMLREKLRQRVSHPERDLRALELKEVRRVGND